MCMIIMMLIVYTFRNNIMLACIGLCASAHVFSRGCAPTAAGLHDSCIYIYIYIYIRVCVHCMCTSLRSCMCRCVCVCDLACLHMCYVYVVVECCVSHVVSCTYKSMSAWDVSTCMSISAHMSRRTCLHVRAHGMRSCLRTRVSECVPGSSNVRTMQESAADNARNRVF